MLAQLGQMCQYHEEDMDAYMKRFHEKALDCCGIVAKDFLVDVFFHRMIYLENLSLSFLSLSMEATRRTNELVRKTSKSILMNSYVLKKRSMTTVM